MEKMDLIIKNGLVYTNGDFVKSDIAVKNEKILCISSSGQMQHDALKVIDVEGCHVLPGLIDSHVHMREPGFTHKEDITTATQAAAAGGVTLAVDMPNVKPSTNSYERTVEQKKLAATKAVVDFNHWVGPPADLKELGKILDEGVIGIKVFMMNDTKRSYPHMPELGILSYGHLFDIFKAIEKENGVCAVHPHSQDMFEWIEQRHFWDKGLTKPVDYCNALRYGDSIVYDCAIFNLLLLARTSKVKLHVLHVNTYLSTKVAPFFKSENVDFSFEMNAPHFFITMDDVKKRGPYVLGTWTPPKDQNALWEAINDKNPSCPILIGTDHAPHHIDEKEIGWENMWKAHGGAPYIQDYLSLFLDAVNKGRVSLKRIVEITSEIPAKRFGFFPKKGLIQPGSDADFAIVDMNKERIISKEQGYSKCGYNPFEGWKVKGIPVHTIVRGKIVMENEKVVGDPGFGEFVPVNNRAK